MVDYDEVCRPLWAGCKLHWWTYHSANKERRESEGERKAGIKLVVNTKGI